MIISCSETESDTVVSDNDYNENTMYRQQASHIFDSIEILNTKRSNDMAQNRMIGNQELTQELVDEYAVMLGYEIGEVGLSDVEEIIDKYNLASSVGIEEFLEEYNYTEFTKLTLKDISEGNWIEGLENQPNYNNLNLNEKELLSLTNAYVQEMEARGSSTANFWAGFGAVVGAIGGSLLCGVCTVVGAILGGWFGWDMGNK